MGNEPSLEQNGLAAAVGCATGFLWSVVAGEADLTKAEGWREAGLGCAGSAINAASIYAISGAMSNNGTLARDITYGWMGVQSAASLTTRAGRFFNIENKAGFKAVALPLNIAAAPLTALVGSLRGGLTLISSSAATVQTFGGTLLFHDRASCDNAPSTTGFTIHCMESSESPHFRHEQGHSVQSALLGDFGRLGIIIGDILVGTIVSDPSYLIFGILSPGKLTLEPWADQYDRSVTKKLTLKARTP